MQAQQHLIHSLVTDVSQIRAEISKLTQDVSTEMWLAGRERRAQLEQTLTSLLTRAGALLVDSIINGTTPDLLSAMSGEIPTRSDIESPIRKEPEQGTITSDAITAIQLKITNGASYKNDDALQQNSQLTATIRSTLKILGQTPSTLNAANRKIERKRLKAACKELLVKWRRIDRAANEEMTSWLVARLRALQAAVKRSEKQGFKRLFGLVLKHLALSQLKQTHGLVRTDRPIGPTWTEDAQNYEAEVCALISSDTPFNQDNALRQLTEQVHAGMDPDAYGEAVLELFRQGVSKKNRRLVRLSIPFLADLDERFSALKKAIRLEIDERCAEERVRPLAIPKNWPHFEQTQGKSAVIVGGDPRPDRAKRLEHEFGFSRLDWIDPKAGHKVDSLVQKMRNGTVELVIVLRAFSRHIVSDKVFANRDCCLVILADTYGVNQVRLGIERFAKTP